MSEHRATIDWSRDNAAFEYNTYTRDHSWTFENGQVVRASAAPGYLGDKSLIDPEEAFVASISSCHMLTLLALLCKGGHEPERYIDRATGYLEKIDGGKLAITRVVLRPEIAFVDGKNPDAGELGDLHEQAHAMCFIANSVKTNVSVESPLG